MEIIEMGIDIEAWSINVTCSKCQSLLNVKCSDIRVDQFKADKNTYWFDGSATSVDAYYIQCKACGDLIILSKPKGVFGQQYGELPELIRRDVETFRRG